MLCNPNFHLPPSWSPLLNRGGQQPQDLITPATATATASGGVWIGQEHPHPALSGCAVVQAPYATASGGKGSVALVGPMRMAYATALAAVEAVAGTLSRLLA